MRSVDGGLVTGQQLALLGKRLALVNTRWPFTRWEYRDGDVAIGSFELCGFWAMRAKGTLGDLQWKLTRRWLSPDIIFEWVDGTQVTIQHRQPWTLVYRCELATPLSGRYTFGPTPDLKTIALTDDAGRVVLEYRVSGAMSYLRPDRTVSVTDRLRENEPLEALLMTTWYLLYSHSVHKQS